ncbi:hypothetical protein [Nocardioides luteus]|uniref:Uncharacterized protein n=1 Tax=Nocardioides luteus TaxID=1844 RepID=A0A1J4N3K3_9ACTN|nr:hypothetical protein [Nocardioides luteus]OIJ26123.1 hypothetical protein UG56_013945 [Nocardioides luteus]
MSTITAPAPTTAVAQMAALFAARTAGRMVGPFLRPIQLLLAWPVASQLVARHNAKAAEEALLLRRAEREDVQHYLQLLASERMTA